MESPTTKGRIPKLIEKAIIMITQITIRRILERNHMVTQVMLDQYSPVMVVVDDFFKHATTMK
jgi:hypothetical protein